MAPSHQHRQRTPTSRSSRRLLDPQGNDAQDGAWPRAELQRMNESFAEAMARAEFTAAGEKADPRFGKRRGS